VKRIAVLGGGPAGAFAAEQLAARGLDVQLFDEKLAWEKPCGGGLSYKAYTHYPFLLDNPTPKRRVTKIVVAGPTAGAVNLKLDDPLLIYSRLDLNRLLLERAAAAGAQLERARIQSIVRHGSGWQLRTSGGVAEADFCIVATGARNNLRDVGAEFGAADVMSALGYYVLGDQAHIEVRFLPKLEGYIWVFPRCGHVSVGICGKGEPASALRGRLEAFMNERGMSTEDARFYSHLLPSLSRRAWRKNRIAGDGWMAVGDAAGLVDPITGEGLFYAIRSGDLAASVLLADGAPAERAAHYRKLLADDFASDLEFGSQLARRFYTGRFLGGGITDRMVQFTRRSERFRAVARDLFSGQQPYQSLKRRLYGNLGGTLWEISRSWFPAEA
jgi:flavin-dependent dehydrogenase